jgi:imidazolonepropionase-like amidohydrolase
MTSILLALLVTLGLIAQSPEPRAELVIRNISVLDVTTGAWLPARDVIVRGTRVSAIRPTGTVLPMAKVVVNGDGKFAIPGLFDNRVDLARLSREQAGRFVANGVTSVCDSGSDAVRLAEWRRDISYGKFMGPRIMEGEADRGQQCGSLPGSGAASAETAGIALHDALAADVRHGRVTAAYALRQATIASAVYYGRSHELGSIAENKIADVIILNGDPLADINNLQRIDAVVFRGETLTRAHLNMLLRDQSPAGARR